MKLSTLQAELPNFKVKVLTAADLADLLALEQSNPAYRQSLGAGEITLAEIQADLVAHPETVTAEQKQVFGFYLAGHLVAMVDVLSRYPKADFMFIGLLMVGADYQRRSVGTVVMMGLMQAALKSNIHCLQLTRVTADAGVAAFWRKLGFEDGDQLFLPLAPSGRLAVTTMTRVLV
ncbi:GNAT family N-acetyltransferase [Lactiplantibacillus mudanjiangensis]|uniref:N-acetyltransferase [Lactobacillus sp.] n=1 Tax=Lactiplantibacillus mudanjiangensis TaxID=1296538 RepID=A0A660E7P9_9LACO|nr:GNAT family N-acetyltransferase [Lactiplantibacillus mudanjiangensis]VDG21083.1 N-acetyltransferase [Lactobacillus sp.] [Lactiplantibacillus mudanjiangensis]VDG22984.1 N-acetyltransferase [Lactobacillus sp.] [Lactiplantibacillus mudanjiangensis]VDG29158.1 N-acetyltransferase [Lactobacillus sp.] [Lactiplantibacillus mudanjiangensis]VDG31678.1 N-acetyltransferase [Lactobacillus sp.] [Lactiplantibacillus mudanjiangensis]